MRIADSVNKIFSKIKSRKVETVIITEKQCPHCVSRGLFVFNDTPKIKSKIGESNEKHK